MGFWLFPEKEKDFESKSVLVLFKLHYKIKVVWLNVVAFNLLLYIFHYLHVYNYIATCQQLVIRLALIVYLLQQAVCFHNNDVCIFLFKDIQTVLKHIMQTDSWLMISMKNLNFKYEHPITLSIM